MQRLADTESDELKRLLAEADDGQTTKQLMVAIAYKNGAGVDELSTQYGIDSSRIRYWLDCFAYDTAENAIAGEPTQ